MKPTRSVVGPCVPMAKTPTTEHADCAYTRRVTDPRYYTPSRPAARHCRQCLAQTLTDSYRTLGEPDIPCVTDQNPRQNFLRPAQRAGPNHASVDRLPQWRMHGVLTDAARARHRQW